MRRSQTTQLLRVLARLHPGLWDIINSHGPVIGVRMHDHVTDRFDEVALNPQPLPPKVQLRLAVQRTARAIADATIAAQVTGRAPDEILQEVGDDWCPTPPDRKIPWPRRWPEPWPPGEPYPIDPELVGPAVQAEAAIVFQSYGSSIADEGLSTAFTQLADRLFDAALEASEGSHG